VVTLLLFGPAREAAGTARADVDGVTVAEIRAAACARFGPAFAAVAEAAAIWLNGEPASSDQPVGPLDEVAVVPPVSGG
jgi:molybdopterin converting factor small subunit